MHLLETRVLYDGEATIGVPGLWRSCRGKARKPGVYHRRKTVNSYSTRNINDCGITPGARRRPPNGGLETRPYLPGAYDASGRRST